MKRLSYTIAFCVITLTVMAQGLELVVPRFHNKEIITLDVSKDAKFLISASEDNVIFLREAITGNYLREFAAKGKIRAVRFLADSRHFLVLTDSSLLVFDLSQAKAQQTFKGVFRGVRLCPTRNEFVIVENAGLRIYSDNNHEFRFVQTIITGHDPIKTCSYSQDGQRIMLSDGNIKMVELTSRGITTVNLKRLIADSVSSLALHKNNQTLAIGQVNGSIYLFDLKKKQAIDSFHLFRTFWSGRYSKGISKDSAQIHDPVQQLIFTPAGKLISSHSATFPDDFLTPTGVEKNDFVDPAELDKMWSNLQLELDGRRIAPTRLIAVWEVNHHSLKFLDQNHEMNYPTAVVNEWIATKSHLYDFEKDEIHSYGTDNTRTRKVKFSATGSKAVVQVSNPGDAVWILDLSGGKNYILEKRLLNSDMIELNGESIGVTPDFSYDHPGLFDMSKLAVADTFKVNGYPMTLNPVKAQIAFQRYDSIGVFDFAGKKSLYRQFDSGKRYTVGFSEDGAYFFAGHRLLETDQFSFVDSLPFPNEYRQPLIMSKSKQVVWFGLYNNQIYTRNFAKHKTGDTLSVFYKNDREIMIRKNVPQHDWEMQHVPEITAMDISPDEKQWAFGFNNGLLAIVDPVNFRVIASWSGLAGSVSSIDFSPDNRYLMTNGEDGCIRLWDAETHDLVARVLFYGKDWVVVNKDRMFDGSSGGLARLFFINGLQTIDLQQLKSRYYEPGLLKKIMSGEKLRAVTGFNAIEVPPEIKVGEVNSQGYLNIDVVDQGGGIGEVALYINGKEVVKDLRTPGQKPKGSTITFSIPVGSQKSLVPGMENFLAVKAWNAGQWVESRGSVVRYVPPARKEIDPEIYVIVCGVSDYTGDAIDLKYASKDADQIANALSLGAHRLFGTEKSHVFTLTGKDQNAPTKVNVLKAFDDIARTATANDILVVYLSGHGINLGGADGDFHYLTQEAYTANPGAYADPAIKKQTTLSSQELVELFKKVPALKQVLMIDACASGKVVDNLMAKRDIESGTLRALDRMKDRTGMHIITGCTADAVSYEASRYGQGILTYSLLEGLRGLALREEKFVDVNELFQFAQERVPVLATGIGGIQTPQVFSPNGSQSFDFGALTAEDKVQIPLAQARPVYIRSTFIDEHKFRDVLGLGKKIDDRLNEISLRGETSPILFTDVSEYPDGCQLSGQYNEVPGKITLKLNKTCAGKEELINLEAVDEAGRVAKVIEVAGK